MKALAPAAAALLALASGGPAAAPDEAPADDVLYPLPPREVAAGAFERWQREAATAPSAATYTRVEYDRKGYWVVESSFGYGDPAEKVAVYAPTAAGSFRRCLLAGPVRAGPLVAAADPTTGLLTLTESANSRTRGAVVLSFNLKAVGVLP